MKKQDFMIVDDIRPWTTKELMLIHTIMQNFQRELKINHNVSLVDAKQWIAINHSGESKKAIEQAKREVFYYAGYSSGHYNIIYLNPRRCTTPQELFNTTYHEMLHIRYPNWSEERVYETANKKYPLMFGQTTKIN